MVQKVVGLFAWAHGAGEAIRGEFNANIAKVVGDVETQRVEEETARRGGREMVNQEFEPVPPLPPRERQMSRRAERKWKKGEKSRN